MVFNYGKLKGSIVEKFGKQSAFAKAIGISEHSVSVKLNNKKPFTQPEIFSICQALSIPSGQIGEYFFAE